MTQILFFSFFLCEFSLWRCQNIMKKLNNAHVRGISWQCLVIDLFFFKLFCHYTVEARTWHPWHIIESNPTASQHGLGAVNLSKPQLCYVENEYKNSCLAYLLVLLLRCNNKLKVLRCNFAWRSLWILWCNYSFTKCWCVVPSHCKLDWECFIYLFIL